MFHYRYLAGFYIRLWGGIAKLEKNEANNLGLKSERENQIFLVWLNGGIKHIETDFEYQLFLILIFIFVSLF